MPVSHVVYNQISSPPSDANVQIHNSTPTLGDACGQIRTRIRSPRGVELHRRVLYRFEFGPMEIDSY